MISHSKCTLYKLIIVTDHPFILPSSGKTLKTQPGRCSLGRPRQQRELPQGQPAQCEIHRCCDQQQCSAFPQAYAYSHQRSETPEDVLCLLSINIC